MQAKNTATGVVHTIQPNMAPSPQIRPIAKPFAM